MGIINDMLKDSYAYTKTALIPNWGRWIALMFCTIIPIVNFITIGYGVRVMKSEPEVPTLEGIGKLFIDGLLLFIISIVYALPVLLGVLVFVIGLLGLNMSGNFIGFIGFIAVAGFGLVLMFILAIIFGMLNVMASVRFAREGRFGAAFEFGEVLKAVKAYAWIDLFAALFVLDLIIFLIVIILEIIPIIGWILLFILLPAFTIVQSRYYALIYDQAI